jgi:hypothetical protein
MDPITLPKGERPRQLERLFAVLSALPPAFAWRIEIFRVQKSRSEAQNNYLWGVVYPAIIKGGGENLAGWTADDLHEYFLEKHFGVEQITGFGGTRTKPKRRSSKLSTVEFMDYVATIQREAAQIGIYVPDPNEELM